MWLLSDYAGLTSYEPTWLHLALLIAGAIILTYPASMLGVRVGYIPSARNAYRRANQIAASQLVPGIIAYFLSVLVCLIGLIAWLVLGGLLVMLGVMRPVETVFSSPVLILMAIVHLAGQVVAWIVAIRVSAPEDNPT